MNLVLVDEVLSSTVAVVVVDRSTRTVDGQLLKVGTTMAVQLSVQVREDSALQQRILGEVDAADDVARLEHDLFGLGKVVGRVGVQLHNTERLDGDVLLGEDLGGVEKVEAVGQCLLLVDDLNSEFPFGTVSGLDGVPQILSVHVGILASNNLGLFPNQRGLSLLGLPVPLHQL